MNKREFLQKGALSTLGLGAFALASPKANAVEPTSDFDKETAEIDYNLVVAVHYFSSRGMKTQIITDNLIVLYPKFGLYEYHTTDQSINDVAQSVNEFKEKYNNKMCFIIMPQEVFVTVDHDNKTIILTTADTYPMANQDLDNMATTWGEYTQSWGWKLIYQYRPDLYHSGTKFTAKNNHAEIGELDIMKDFEQRNA